MRARRCAAAAGGACALTLLPPPSFLGSWVFVVLTCCLWALLFFALFVSLDPRRAEARPLLAPARARSHTRGVAVTDLHAASLALSPRAQKLMGPRLFGQMMAQVARADAFLLRFTKYRPKLKFDPNTPGFVRDLITSSENDRVARENAADAAAAAARRAAEL